MVDTKETPLGSGRFSSLLAVERDLEGAGELEGVGALTPSSSSDCQPQSATWLTLSLAIEGSATARSS